MLFDLISMSTPSALVKSVFRHPAKLLSAVAHEIWIGHLVAAKNHRRLIDSIEIPEQMIRLMCKELSWSLSGNDQSDPR